MKLNLRINDYPIALTQKLNEAELKNIILKSLVSLIVYL